MAHPIILVRRNVARGDVLLTTPVLRQLKKDRPDSLIFVETEFPQIFEHNPCVHTAATHISPHPDWVVYDLNMAYENRPMRHILDSYAEVACCKPEDRVLDLTVEKKILEWADNDLSELQHPRVALAPGPTSWEGKNWTEEGWNVLSASFRQNGWSVVLIGGPSPLSVPSDMDYRGRTDFLESAAVVSRCDLFVGLDSFPLHLAMSQRVPAVGLFGVTCPELILSEGRVVTCQADREQFPEIGARHREPGKVFMQSTGDCMRAITPEHVLAAVQRLIGMTDRT